jgi:anti-anti-sigma factor
MTQELVLTLGHGPVGPVLTVAGDLDYTSAHLLRAAVGALALEPGQQLTLELSGLAFSDSSGITALLAARNRVHAQAAEIVLSNVPPTTVRVLGLLGLEEVFRTSPAPGSV